MTLFVQRFVVFTTAASHPPHTSHHGHHAYINVVEMKAEAKRLPQSVRDRNVRRVLLRTKPLLIDGDDTPGIRAFTRAERVVETLLRMDMALQAWELEDRNHGIQNLFNHLWESEEDE